MVVQILGVMGVHRGATVKSHTYATVTILHCVY